jgi:hypothetical protein
MSEEGPRAKETSRAKIRSISRKFTVKGYQRHLQISKFFLKMKT